MTYKEINTMTDLTINEINSVSGGSVLRGLGTLGIIATVAEGMYEFYQGYSDHRN